LELRPLGLGNAAAHRLEALHDELHGFAGADEVLAAGFEVAADVEVGPAQVRVGLVVRLGRVPGRLVHEPGAVGAELDRRDLDSVGTSEGGRKSEKDPGEKAFHWLLPRSIIPSN